MAGCQAALAGPRASRSYESGADDEEEIARPGERHRGRLVALARLVERDVGLATAGARIWSAPKPFLKLMTSRCCPGLVGIGHDDQAVGPTDIEDAAVPFVDGLDVVDAGGRRISTRPSAELAFISGSPRSPARWTVAARLGGHFVGPVEHSQLERQRLCRIRDLIQRRKRRDERQREAAPHRGILTPRAIVFLVMDVYLVPVGPDRHELYCEVPDEPDTDAGDATGESDSHQPRGFLRRIDRVAAWFLPPPAHAVSRDARRGRT